MVDRQLVARNAIQPVPQPFEARAVYKYDNLYLD